jgi:hypothetical protein
VAKVRFEPVRRQFTPCKHIAGVVDEHIDAGLGSGNLLADPFHFGKKREIGEVHPMGGVGASLTQLRKGGLRPLLVPCHQYDSRSKCSKPRGGDVSDARGGTGDDDDLPVNGGLLGSFACRDLLHQEPTGFRSASCCLASGLVERLVL